MTTPLVSICLPCLNGAEYMRARLDSILAQTLGDWELIVCDSYSSDGSWDLFREYAVDQRVSLFQVPRKGIYAGWNECLRRARGKYVTIATADDTANIMFLEKMTDLLEHHHDVHLAMCQFDFINGRGEIVPDPAGERPNTCFGEWQVVAHRRSGKAEFLAHLTRGGSWTTITSVLFTRELLERAGLFIEQETPVVDQLWAAKAALLTDTIWLPERLATWRIHGAQGSSRWTRRNGLRQVQLTAQTLRDCEALIPAEWKTNPEWRTWLMWGALHFYRSCYGLNRATLKTQPRKFLADLAWNLRHEPSYVISRLASGLSWSASEYQDSAEVFHRLVHQFKVPWPPVAIEY